jgi:hypothetical protein
MGNPTICAGYPKALLDFAVSRGADRLTLITRSHIHPDELLNQDNRIALANYLAMLEGGIELCSEPALALLFGEAVGLPDISIVGLIGPLSENSEEGRRQMNRYGRLALDEDDGDASDPMEIVREGRDVWVRSTSRIYAENPLLTESAFARTVCGARALLASMPEFAYRPFPKAIRFTHKEPGYRAEYDRIFGVPLFFESPMNSSDGPDPARARCETQRLKTAPFSLPHNSGVTSASASSWSLQRMSEPRSSEGEEDALVFNQS